MITVMIAGLPGQMATMVAKAIQKEEDMKLLGSALAEAEGNSKIIERSINHVPLADHKQIIRDLSPNVILDFTAPNAVNRNAELYCECGIPFVMGTTGGDRKRLVETVEHSNIPAVIAPNMAKQIVVLLAMMEFAAKNFPKSFQGYRLVIRESHQQVKKDTSGTAKVMASYFNTLGVPFAEDQIIMERNPAVQEVAWHIPSQYLSGHGYHTYELLSQDGTVFFQFTHNVNGRNIYVPGALDAIRFLSRQEKGKGKVFSMTDVLRG